MIQKLGTQKMIGVCMVTGVYCPRITGGGLQLRSVVLALKDKVNFFIISADNECNSISKDLVDGVMVYRVRVNPESILENLSSIARFIKVFLKIIPNVQIIHIHGFTKKAILFIILGKFFRKKVILKTTMISADEPLAVKRKMGNFAYYIYSNIDIFICISEAFRLKYIESKLPLTKMRFIPNGVDTDIFKPLESISEKNNIRRELGIFKERKIILFVGYFSKIKGVNLLVKAWKIIREEFKDRVGLVLIGSRDPRTNFYIDAELVAQIEEEIARDNMQSDFIFVEKTFAMDKFYKAADIFVLPSLIEGMPNALLEAMASGLPCIATRLEGITDTIISHRQSGLLFNINNTEQLAENFRELLISEDSAYQLGQNARKEIVNNYSIDRIAKQYFDLYSSISN